MLILVVAIAGVASGACARSAPRARSAAMPAARRSTTRLDDLEAARPRPGHRTRSSDLSCRPTTSSRCPLEDVRARTPSRGIASWRPSTDDRRRRTPVEDPEEAARRARRGSQAEIEIRSVAANLEAQQRRGRKHPGGAHQRRAVPRRRHGRRVLRASRIDRRRRSVSCSRRTASSVHTRDARAIRGTDSPRSRTRAPEQRRHVSEKFQDIDKLLDELSATSQRHSPLRRRSAEAAR